MNGKNKGHKSDLIPFSIKFTHGSFPSTSRVLGERKSSFFIVPSSAMRLIEGPKARATLNQNSSAARNTTDRSKFDNETKRTQIVRPARIEKRSRCWQKENVRVDSPLLRHIVRQLFVPDQAVLVAKFLQILDQFDPWRWHRSERRCFLSLCFLLLKMTVESSIERRRRNDLVSPLGADGRGDERVHVC